MVGKVRAGLAFAALAVFAFQAPLRAQETHTTGQDATEGMKQDGMKPADKMKDDKMSTDKMADKKKKSKKDKKKMDEKMDQKDQKMGKEKNPS